MRGTRSSPPEAPVYGTYEEAMDAWNAEAAELAEAVLLEQMEAERRLGRAGLRAWDRQYLPVQPPPPGARITVAQAADAFRVVRRRERSRARRRARAQGAVSRRGRGGDPGQL